MPVGLTQLASEPLTPQVCTLLAGILGHPAEADGIVGQSELATASILAGLAQQFDAGHQASWDAICQADPSLLDDLPARLGGGNHGTLLQQGTQLLATVFPSVKPLRREVASATGFSREQAETLLKLLAPIVVSAVNGFCRQQQLDADGLRQTLQAERSNLAGLVPDSLRQLLQLADVEQASTPPADAINADDAEPLTQSDSADPAVAVVTPEPPEEPTSPAVQPTPAGAATAAANAGRSRDDSREPSWLATLLPLAALLCVAAFLWFQYQPLGAKQQLDIGLDANGLVLPDMSDQNLGVPGLDVTGLGNALQQAAASLPSGVQAAAEPLAAAHQQFLQLDFRALPVQTRAALAARLSTQTQQLTEAVQQAQIPAGSDAERLVSQLQAKLAELKIAGSWFGG